MAQLESGNYCCYATTQVINCVLQGLTQCPVHFAKAKLGKRAAGTKHRSQVIVLPIQKVS